ncbi:MAG: DUF4325 domain-containing protein [Myxococcota bacterium]
MDARDRAILELIAKLGVGSNRDVVDLLGVSRQAATARLSKLVETGRLLRVGAGRSTRYRRAAVEPTTSVVREYGPAGLEEERVWEELQAASSVLGALRGDGLGLFHYALTEMVNNAIDHADGTRIVVRVASRPEGRIGFEVEDDGVGAFRRLQTSLGLESELHALQTVSKGRHTTQPDRHSGEGLFFTSKAAALFELESGALRWVVDNLRGEHAIGQVEPPRQGTLVRFEASPTEARPLRALFAEYTRDFEFVRTHTVVKLFEHGTRFVSRSEAKRLLEGLERFDEIVVDFAGVSTVGQGFADEVFRVWPRTHADKRMVPVNMNDAVAFFVERARRARG